MSRLNLELREIPIELEMELQNQVAPDNHAASLCSGARLCRLTERIGLFEFAQASIGCPRISSLFSVSHKGSLTVKVAP